MNALTARTRIEYRWTTNPADCGYDGRPSNWRTGKPDAVGTPRTILQRADTERRLHISPGTIHNDEYRVAGTGEVISREEIEETVRDWDYERGNGEAARGGRPYAINCGWQSGRYVMMWGLNSPDTCDSIQDAEIFIAASASEALDLFASKYGVDESQLIGYSAEEACTP